MKIFGPFTEKDQELLDFHLLIYSLTAVLFISSVLLFRKMFPESSPIFHNSGRNLASSTVFSPFTNGRMVDLGKLVSLVLSFWGKQVLKVSYIGILFSFLLFLGQVLNTLQRQSLWEELVTEPVFLISVWCCTRIARSMNQWALGEKTWLIQEAQVQAVHLSDMGPPLLTLI